MIEIVSNINPNNREKWLKGLLEPRLRLKELLVEGDRKTDEQTDIYWHMLIELERDISNIRKGGFPAYYPGFLFQIFGIKQIFNICLDWEVCTTFNDYDWLKTKHYFERNQFQLKGVKEGKIYAKNFYYQEIKTIEGIPRNKWQEKKLKEKGLNNRGLILFEDYFWVNPSTEIIER